MRRAVTVLLAAMMVLALTACQATPDEQFVVKKDTERMVEQAKDNSSGTTVSKLKVPDEKYTYSTSAADGRLIISVDATVTVPESKKIPTARVSETGFTQEQVTVFFNHLFPDEQPVTGDNVPHEMTKDEIQERIIAYKQYINEGTTEQYMCTEEEMEEEIKKLEQEYMTAPETAPALDIQASDGTMVRTTIPVGADEEEILELDAGTADKRIYVCVPLDENGSWENYFGLYGNRTHGFSDMNAVRVDEADWRTIAGGKLTISYEDAKALCDGFFDAGGITDVALSDAFVIDDEQTTQGYAHGPENYAYQFQYVRTVGDCPAANMSCFSSRGDRHSLPWDFEKIIFLVSDNGIEHINWDCHTTTGEIINEDTGVISFEDAREIFETMIVTTYGASGEWPSEIDKVNVEINGIELSLVRVREQNASGRNGIYTPAWVFYGNVKQELKIGGNNIFIYGWDANRDYPFTKYPVLVINAIDGSIIDLSKGY